MLCDSGNSLCGARKLDRAGGEKDFRAERKRKKKTAEIETLTGSREELRRGDEWSPLGKVSSTTSDNPTWSPPKYPGITPASALSLFHFNGGDERTKNCGRSTSRRTVHSPFWFARAADVVEFLKMIYFWASHQSETSKPRRQNNRESLHSKNRPAALVCNLVWERV